MNQIYYSASYFIEDHTLPGLKKDELLSSLGALVQPNWQPAYVLRHQLHNKAPGRQEQNFYKKRA